MSRHHIQQPIVYVPLPRLKPAKSRPKTGRLLNGGKSSVTSDAGATDESDEVGGLGSAATFGRQSATDSPSSFALPDRNGGPAGRLSETTLKTMLQIQERTNSAR